MNNETPITIGTKVQLKRTLCKPFYKGMLTLKKGDTLVILEVDPEDCNLHVRCGNGNASWWFNPADLECAE